MPNPESDEKDVVPHSGDSENLETGVSAKPVDDLLKQSPHDAIRNTRRKTRYLAGLTRVL